MGYNPQESLENKRMTSWNIHHESRSMDPIENVRFSSMSC